jgi:hypothetical protein
MNNVILGLEIPPEKHAEIDKLFSKFERKLAKALVGCVTFSTAATTTDININVSTGSGEVPQIDISRFVENSLRRKSERRL